MTNQVIVTKEKRTISESITAWANKNFFNRMLGEALSAFVLIFAINSVIALGEDGVKPFTIIYKTNLGSGLWIGFMTMWAFTWTNKTTLSANMINLLLTKKDNRITKKEFWWSILFQFIGGFTAGFLVYAIAALASPDWYLGDAHIMGGTKPAIKMYWLEDASSMSGLIDFTDNTDFAYIFAAIQGLICSTWIIVGFMVNRVADDKSKNATQQWLIRYIILIVGITITTMFYANTTNPIRLLSPAIANAVMGRTHGSLYLSTTIVFILFQLIGMIIVYFEIFAIKRTDKEREEDGI